MESGDALGGDGWLLKADELIGEFALGGCEAGIEFDVGSGEECAEAGDSGASDAGADDPKLGVFVEEFAGAGGEADADDDAFEVFPEADGFDFADFDAAGLYFGLSGDDAFGGIEADEGLGAEGLVVGVDEVEPEDEGDDGHDPDSTWAVASLRGNGGLGDFVAGH